MQIHMETYRKHIVIALIFSFSLPASSLEVDASLGGGARYAGFVGAQVIATQNNHAMRGALGLLGVSAGYDYKITKNISLGATIGDFAFLPFDGPKYYSRAKTVDFTYFFSGEFTSGWNLGFGVGNAKNAETICFGCIDSDNKHKSSIKTVNIGYTF